MILAVVSLWSGASSAVRRGVTRSRGPYVAPVRVDDLHDVWRPGTLAGRKFSFFKASVRAMQWTLLAAVVVLGVLTPAGAMTGNELREYCATRWEYCHGFIVGAVEMFRYQMEVVNPICFAEGVTWEQVHDVVLDYMEEHPESREEHALILVTWAIREAFDCPKTQGRSMGKEGSIG
jgi:hypothetical protein